MSVEKPKRGSRRTQRKKTNLKSNDQLPTRPTPVRRRGRSVQSSGSLHVEPSRLGEGGEHLHSNEFQYFAYGSDCECSCCSQI